MDFYRERIDGLEGGRSDLARAEDRLATEFWLVGVRAERDQLVKLARNRDIASETARKINRELDLSEARHRG